LTADLWDWGTIVAEGKLATPAELNSIIGALEAQLDQLDRLGAQVAAAHLVSAINQLRGESDATETGSADAIRNFP